MRLSSSWEVLPISYSLRPSLRATAPSPALQILSRYEGLNFHLLVLDLNPVQRTPSSSSTSCRKRPGRMYLSFQRPRNSRALWREQITPSPKQGFLVQSTSYRSSTGMVATVANLSPSLTLPPATLFGNTLTLKPSSPSNAS